MKLEVGRYIILQWVRLVFETVTCSVVRWDRWILMPCLICGSDHQIVGCSLECSWVVSLVSWNADVACSIDTELFTVELSPSRSARVISRWLVVKRSVAFAAWEYWAAVRWFAAKVTWLTTSENLEVSTAYTRVPTMHSCSNWWSLMQEWSFS